MASMAKSILFVVFFFFALDVSGPHDCDIDVVVEFQTVHPRNLRLRKSAQCKETHFVCYEEDFVTETRRSE